jgi:glyoxylase-like metal-dependent hydrolase (beta-lactamase superfamily II)
MALGDLYHATAADTTDLHYVDTQMYDVSMYGPSYILDADRPALVDTGTGRNSDTVIEAMGELGIAPADLEVIALTHVHLDHAGGAFQLIEDCPNADVYVPAQGARHLRTPEHLWKGTKQAVGTEIQWYAEPEPMPEARIVELTDGDQIDLGDHALEVHAAPGHAPHQVVYYDPANDGVFTADSAGIYSAELDRLRETTPPANFDFEQSLADLDTLREIDPSAIYYGHFGDFPTEDRIDRYEQVLTDWVEAVRDVRADLEDDEAVVEYFQERDDVAEQWGERRADAEVEMNVRGVLIYLDNQDA